MAEREKFEIRGDKEAWARYLKDGSEDGVTRITVDKVLRAINEEKNIYIQYAIIDEGLYQESRLIIKGDLIIKNSKIRRVYLGGADFGGEVNFEGTTFISDWMIKEAVFCGKTSFSGATFSSRAYFYKATFKDETFFRGATFSSKAQFNYAKFYGVVDFGSATFSDGVNFVDAIVKDEISFRGITFNVHFSDNKLKEAFFSKSSFKGETIFGKESGSRNYVTFDDIMEGF